MLKLITLILIFPHFTFASDSRLSWGKLLDTKSSNPNIKRYQEQILFQAKDLAAQKMKATEKILSEGKLPTEAGVSESRAAVKEMLILPKLSVCARLTTDLVLQKNCKDSALRGLLLWASIYKPNGNPINECSFIPWIEAWDLMRPLLSEAEINKLDNFAKDLLLAGDLYYQNLKVTNGRFYNNWASWRLAIRSLISFGLADQSLIKTSQALLETHLEHNLKQDGVSIDFLERDALHYHVYDLEALTITVAHLPENFISKKSKSSIETALLFLKPYFLAEKNHLEFVHSNIAFDLKRKNARLSEYQNIPWDPNNARKLFRLSRVLFPSLKSWTQNIVDESYDLFFKLQIESLEK